MRRAAYWLFPIIAIAVAIFIVVFMVQINPSSSLESETAHENDTNVSVSTNEEAPGWLKRLKLTTDTGYAYPVNDVSLETDSGSLDSKVKRYRLIVNLKDSYEFFCLKQELKNTTFSYLLNQNGESMSVVIDSNDDTGLTNLVSKLKTYQITATLSPYKED
ncbi:MAG: hypothetical protein PHW18_04460 [Sulfuricurvum sp.]|uniref:hypothetical protein n=1 Tax=Sulfuricurvum sp. TaxID=2025608 RepID=UPI00260BA4D6|nr:hypothetical protein [Sulfuricurvum sp.]MDD2828807.1 hypothetical protein [Sulfuricurvum sp.]MDD4948734.1 hypothetical protein [Sulfuricurvum sp.]